MRPTILHHLCWVLSFSLGLQTGCRRKVPPPPVQVPEAIASSSQGAVGLVTEAEASSYTSLYLVLPSEVAPGLAATSPVESSDPDPVKESSGPVGIPTDSTSETSAPSSPWSLKVIVPTLVGSVAVGAAGGYVVHLLSKSGSKVGSTAGTSRSEPEGFDPRLSARPDDPKTGVLKHPVPEVGKPQAFKGTVDAALQPASVQPGAIRAGNAQQVRQHLRNNPPDMMDQAVVIVPSTEVPALRVALQSDHPAHRIEVQKLDKPDPSIVSRTNTDQVSAISLVPFQRLSARRIFKAFTTTDTALPTPTGSAKMSVTLDGTTFDVERLGSGTFGTTYKYTDVSSDTSLAVKVFHNETKSRDELDKMAPSKRAGRIESGRAARLREAMSAHRYMEILRDEPQFLRSFGVFQTRGLVVHLQELGGKPLSATSVIRAGPRPLRTDDQEFGRIGVDILEGLSTLERKELIHGDIKAGNFILGLDGRAKFVDLDDMRSARDGGRGQTYTRSHMAPERKDNRKHTIDPGKAGLGPEDIENAVKLTIKRDVFSVAMTFLEIRVGRDFPKTSNYEVKEGAEGLNKVEIGKLHDAIRKASLSQEEKNLYIEMLDFDPSKRLSASEALKKFRKLPFMAQ